jgi:hypothetical protein
MKMKKSLCAVRALLRPALIVALAFVAVSLSAGVTRAGEQFEISVVSWKAEKLELKVAGFAEKPDSLVMVRDADTQALLGCAAVRADGKWMLKLRNPKKVPTRMRFESDEGVQERDVVGVDVAAK